MKLLSRIAPLERKRMCKRLGIVWGVALVIAVIQWAASGYGPERFKIALVYSYAIGTAVWFFNDPCRYWLQRQEAREVYNVPFTVFGCVLGFLLGTWVGDTVSGWSIFSLWIVAPAKLVGLLLGSVAISTAFTAYFMQRGKAERMARENTEARLRLLQSQLEPHMLFNTLANLRALVAQDAAQAQAMLDRLIAFLRATLQASRQTHHSAQEEFSRLSDYLVLMQIRMGQRLAFALELPEALADLPIPPLILQPLVENSIRHGLEPQVRGGTVRVSAELQGQLLCLRVQDDGAGFEDAATVQGAASSGKPSGGVVRYLVWFGPCAPAPAHSIWQPGAIAHRNTGTRWRVCDAPHSNQDHRLMPGNISQCRTQAP